MNWLRNCWSIDGSLSTCADIAVAAVDDLVAAVFLAMAAAVELLLLLLLLAEVLLFLFAFMVPRDAPRLLVVMLPLLPLLPLVTVNGSEFELYPFWFVTYRE